MFTLAIFLDSLADFRKIVCPVLEGMPSRFRWLEANIAQPAVIQYIVPGSNSVAEKKAHANQAPPPGRSSAQTTGLWTGASMEARGSVTARTGVRATRSARGTPARLSSPDPSLDFLLFSCE